MNQLEKYVRREIKYINDTLKHPHNQPDTQDIRYINYLYGELQGFRRVLAVMKDLEKWIKN